MRPPRWSVLFICPVLALTACDAKPKPAPKPANQDFIQAQSQAHTGNACSGVPDKTSIASAIKAAMADTYGTDEAPAQFVVVSAQPQDNCSHLKIVYHMKGNGQQSQTASAVIGNGGQWYLDFYRKRYPIH